MTRTLIFAALALGLAAPVAAGEFDEAAAESRLRGCLLAGSNSAVEGDLRTKVAEVRAFCGAQIGKVREKRTAGLSRTEKAEAIRALDYEIAQAIAGFTGKTTDLKDIDA